jgi:hypothetical protein
MRPRIKLLGIRVASTRSSTTTESTTFYKKVEHLDNIIHKKLVAMGIKPEVKKVV